MWRCSPGSLRELAAGWLLGEGVIASETEIADITVHEAGEAPDPPESAMVRIDVCLADRTPGRFEADRRDAVPRSTLPRSAAGMDWLKTDWRDLYERMYLGAPLRAAGGGVHTGTFVREREILALEEDVGRHNVVDKLIGRAMREGLPLPGSVLLLSGRISGSIAAKAARAGVAGLISLSIPTTMAVDTAAIAGLTLVGRARRGTPLVYSPPRSSG